MFLKKINLFVLLLVFIIGCNDVQNNTDTQSQESQITADTNDQQQQTTKTYTIEEISQHNTKKDCWLLIHGKIYDVTEFIQSHPGGSAILEGCGKDATTYYETRPMGSGTPHSDKARSFLPDYYIGELA